MLRLDLRYTESLSGPLATLDNLFCTSVARTSMGAYLLNLSTLDLRALWSPDE